MSQQTQNRGGWVASFIIVGAVLVLGLLAGLYYLKSRQIEQTAQPVAVNQETDDSPAPTPSSGQKDDHAQTPATENNDKESRGSDSTDNQASTPANQQNSDSNISKESRNELPVTGPADLGAQFLAVAALAVASVAYIQSRRSL